MKTNRGSTISCQKRNRCFGIAVLTFSLGTADCVQAASTIQFTTNSYTFAESEGFATIAVQRLNDPGISVSVDYTTLMGQRPTV
jgi:hypothetical protein